MSALRPTRCLVLVIALAAGCGKKAPECEAVVDHLMTVLKQGLTGHDGMQLASRKGLIDTCEGKHYSDDMRNCLMATKDLQGMSDCQNKFAPPPPAPGGPPGPGAPPAPAPAPSAATAGSTAP